MQNQNFCCAAFGNAAYKRATLPTLDSNDSDGGNVKRFILNLKNENIYLYLPSWFVLKPYFSQISLTTSPKFASCFVPLVCRVKRIVFFGNSLKWESLSLSPSSMMYPFYYKPFFGFNSIVCTVGLFKIRSTCKSVKGKCCFYQLCYITNRVLSLGLTYVYPF